MVTKLNENSRLYQLRLLCRTSMGIGTRVRLKLFLLVVVVLFLFLAIRTFPNVFLTRTNTNPSIEIKKKVVAPPKLILIYNTLWGNRLWPGFETTQRFNNWGGHPCKVQNCRLTYNKKMLSKADVVIFHGFGGDMLSKREMLKLQAKRNINSYWVYFIHESPQNARPPPGDYDGYFNLTMGYRRDADITVPYNWEWGTWEKRGVDDPPYRHRNYAQDKDKLIWGGISHCGCIRESYLKKLKDYIPLDIYGRCGKVISNRVPPECPRGSADCNRRLKKYKFYLAFENSFCLDYYSEKFSETVLDGHTIPVVMGGAEYKEVGMPRSYIDVNDFDTIEDLGNYIKYLDENEDAYNRHFEFRKYYKLGKPRSWSCKICEMINSGTMKPKIYHKLGDWYSIKNNCGTRLQKLREILHRSQVPRPYTDEYYHHDMDF